MAPYITNQYFHTTIVFNNGTSSTQKMRAKETSEKAAAAFAWIPLSKEDKKNVERIEVTKYSHSTLPEGFDNFKHQFPELPTNKLTDPVSFLPAALANLQENIKRFQGR